MRIAIVKIFLVLHGMFGYKYFYKQFIHVYKNILYKVAPLVGLEPTTYRLEGDHSIQLSYKGGFTPCDTLRGEGRFFTKLAY